MSDPMLPVGTNYCKCSGCGLYFGGVSSFDLHRYQMDGGGCFAPDQVQSKKGEPLLKLNERGYWVSARPVRFGATSKESLDVGGLFGGFTDG